MYLVDLFPQSVKNEPFLEQTRGDWNVTTAATHSATYYSEPPPSNVILNSVLGRVEWSTAVAVLLSLIVYKE